MPDWILIALLSLTFVILVFMKLSELNGRVTALNTKADTILARLPVDTGDPDVPAEADTGLSVLEGKLDSAIAQLPEKPAPPTP